MHLCYNTREATSIGKSLACTGHRWGCPHTWTAPKLAMVVAKMMSTADEAAAKMTSTTDERVAKVASTADAAEAVVKIASTAGDPW